MIARHITCLIAVTALILANSVARAELIYGMTGANSSANAGIGLVSFDSASPGTVMTIGAFTGLTSGHDVRSIDFRPLTGQLYAISTDATGMNAQLYTVNLSTAALTPVGSGFSLGTNTSLDVEMDFNPTVDLVRIVTAANPNSGQNNNFRANPITGALVATDSNLAYDPADSAVTSGNAPFLQIRAAAYSNNFAGATMTTLFAWDWQTDSLVMIGGPNSTPSPNTGVVFTISNPGTFLTTGDAIGMDISGLTGVLYTTHDSGVSTAMSLWTRDTTTGALANLGSYPAGTFVIDISVVPEPTSVALFGIAAAAFVCRRFRRRR